MKYSIVVVYYSVLRCTYNNIVQWCSVVVNSTVCTVKDNSIAVQYNTV